MFRPRADMKGFGVEKIKLVGGGDREYDTLSNNVPVGGRPILTVIDGKKEMKYFDYMCPQCKIVLFYGEKNDNTR